jgi:uncharacterized glyoxalase superfamily protein PhnB
MTDPFDPSGFRPNRSMPPGTVIPQLAYADVESAVDWLCNTFGFKARLLIRNHRCQVTVGEGSVIVAKGNASAGSSAATHSIMVRVADVDAHYAHVVACGLPNVNPPDTYLFGERQYTVDDPGGHRWTFSQSVADVPPEEWGGELIEGD